MNIEENIKSFEEDGYVMLKQCIDHKLIDQTQAYAADFLGCNKMPESIIESMDKLESSNNKFFYEFCKRMGKVNSVTKIALQENILLIVQGILNTENVHLTDRAVFYNKLSVKRLQYDWHQENSYFPNADEVITLWYPWLHSVNQANGTMVMAKGGHRSKHLSKKIPVQDGLTQMKISEDILADFDKINCDLELGDAILFSFNSPHRTGNNSSGVPRSTIIARYTNKVGKFNNGWDPVSY